MAKKLSVLSLLKRLFFKNIQSFDSKFKSNAELPNLPSMDCNGMAAYWWGTFRDLIDALFVEEEIVINGERSSDGT